MCVQVVTRTRFIFFGRDCGGVRIRTGKKNCKGVNFSLDLFALLVIAARAFVFMARLDDGLTDKRYGQKNRRCNNLPPNSPMNSTDCKIV
jgi:hypothetical protein